MSTLANLPSSLSTQSRDAYEAIAPSYDVLTESYQHDLWLERLEEIAIWHGLAGKRLLDLACGTGKSFLPLVGHGYDVTGCDNSPAMLAIAKRKAPSALLYEADLRELPAFGTFDLVTALDDPLNYLLSETELEAALSGIARNLADHGLAIVDLNTLAQYRRQFAQDSAIDRPPVFVAWRGRDANRAASDGAVVEASVDIFTTVEGGLWVRSSSVHRQRHWPRSTVERLARSAGLELLAVYGQRPGVQIDPQLDELVHIKAIYLARKLREGATMTIGGL